MDFFADILTWLVVWVLRDLFTTILVAGAVFLTCVAASVAGILSLQSEAASIPELNVWDLLPEVNRQLGEAATSRRLTALTVSILESVIPTALAATSTGRTQRDLGAGVSSALLTVRLRVKEASAAAVTAAVSGATVRTIGLLLPAPNGGSGPRGGPPTSLAAAGGHSTHWVHPLSVVAYTARRAVVRRGCSMWVLLPRGPTKPP